MKIESQDKDIESLLDGNYFFIPRFQRPYSWDSENLGDFWVDVIANKSTDYFIGSMVVYKKAKQEFGVVDGQQRLTTITIFLCALRDRFLALGHNDLAKGIHQLVERKDRNNKKKYILRTESSFPYFQEFIQKYDDTPDASVEAGKEEIHLKNAKEIFTSNIDNLVCSIDLDPAISDEDKDETKKNRLIELRDAVLNLSVIFVVLDNEDDAYLIFETLNTRGKDLALTDLVKNHFTKLLKAQGDVDHTKLKWIQILDTIQKSSADLNTDTFIYHYWASRYESIPLKKLFPAFRKAVTKTNSKKYLSEIVTDSEYYRSIFESTFKWNKNEASITRCLEAYSLFRLAQPLPAILSLVRAYKSKSIKLKKFKEALQAIENFHFTFTAITSSRSSGGISAMYSSFAQKLHACTDPQACADVIEELISKLKDRVPSFDEFLVGYREVVFTNTSSKQKNLVRYILRKHSEYSKFKYPCDYDELTIEHLYPQSKIDNGKWTEGIVGSLGNLYFIDESSNGKLGTKSFPEKKKLLKKWGYSLPVSVSSARSWTPEKVIQHTEEMAKVAYNKIWKI